VRAISNFVQLYTAIYSAGTDVVSPAVIIAYSTVAFVASMLEVFSIYSSPCMSCEIIELSIVRDPRFRHQNVSFLDFFFPLVEISKFNRTY
jgi:hypothetical protein